MLFKVSQDASVVNVIHVARLKRSQVLQDVLIDDLLFCTAVLPTLVSAMLTNCML